MHRFWIVEWSEVGTVFSKREYEDVKAFLSRQEDTLRRPYGSGSETLKRSFVIGASSNEDELFRDPTGNRRFWPITVGDKIDLEYLKAHRDEIWAAAVALYKAGEQWHLTSEEAEQSAERVKDYQESHPWENIILEKAGPSGRVTTSWLLYQALGIQPALQKRSDQMAVQRILTSDGWVRKQIRNKATKKQEWIYEKDWVGDGSD
jgi:predicted P-loop ATPase